MLFVAFSLLLFIHVLRVYFLLVQLVHVLSCFSFGLLCMGIWASWIWMDISFPTLVIFFTIIFSKISSYLFFFSFSSVIPKIQILVCLVTQRSLTLSSFFSCFLFILLCFSYLHHSIFHSFASAILLLVPSIVFFYFSYCVVHCWMSIFYFF